MDEIWMDTTDRDGGRCLVRADGVHVEWTREARHRRYLAEQRYVDAVVDR